MTISPVRIPIFILAGLMLANVALAADDSWQPLFNGKDLTGWTFSDPSRAGRWKVEDGTLVSHGKIPDIITTSKFEDFKLHLEFNCGPQSNSGVYLRGRDEVQIETDSVQEPPSHHTGGVYGFLDPTPELPRKPGEWRTFDITLLGRIVTVVQDGQTVIDHKVGDGESNFLEKPFTLRQLAAKVRAVLDLSRNIVPA